MKKLSMGFVLAILITMFVVGTALAAPGGQPGAHELEGREFGAAVSGLEPGAISDHVSNAGGNGGGMPAAHGVSGRDFGAAVSGLEPGAIADHVSNK
jgi:hypothetical protein